MSPNAPANSSRHDVTLLLEAWSQGDSSALNKLAPLIYTELRKMARRYIVGDRNNQTLETGALLNEAYLRLFEWKGARFENRAHFYGVAAQIMRRVLVDQARSRGYMKRGAGVRPLSLDDAIVMNRERSRDLVALDEALDRLAAQDPRKSKVVELRFFGGLSVEEIAEVLQVSSFTVMRDWRLAKAWLHRELRIVRNGRSS